jgi:multidrug efflux pump subunit AcrA (membrane-fusion protein)
VLSHPPVDAKDVEIPDPLKLDVRCELTAPQADDVALGQLVKMRVADTEQPLPDGRLISIAPVADQKSGLVPVLVRLRNSDKQLRCGVSVSMRFLPGPVVYRK